MDRNVNFTLETSVLGHTVSAFVLIPDEGIHVSVYGGEKSHIGAVCIIAPDGTRQAQQFPGHRDLVIAEKWAGALYEAGYCPVTAEAGIHYDNLSKADILTIIAASDALLEEVLSHLSEA